MGWIGARLKDDLIGALWGELVVGRLTAALPVASTTSRGCCHATPRREKKRRVITRSIIITWNEAHQRWKISNSGALHRGRDGVLELLQAPPSRALVAPFDSRIPDAPLAPLQHLPGCNRTLRDDVLHGVFNVCEGNGYPNTLKTLKR